MVVSSGDGGGGAAGAEVDSVTWCGGVGVVTQTELTPIVISPALHGAIVEYYAGVVSTGGDFYCGAAGAEVDGIAGFVGFGVVTVAELSTRVRSPALHGAVVEYCARVRCAGGDCGGGASGAEVDGCAWCGGVGVVSVAELARTVVAPAGDLTVVEYCARVKCAGGDCGCGASGAEVDGVAGCVGAGVVSVAELARTVVAPALYGAVVEDGAGVVVSSGDCGGGAAGAEVDGFAWFVGVGGVAVAELTPIVISPALYGAVVEDGAGVVVSSGDCGCGASGAEVDGVAGCVGVGVVSVAELSSRIRSPAGDLTVVEECAGMRVTVCARNWCET